MCITYDNYCTSTSGLIIIPVSNIEESHYMPITNG